MSNSQDEKCVDGAEDLELNFHRFLLQNRVWILLVALAAHIGLTPLISKSPLLEVFIEIGLILACVITATDTRKHFILAMSFGIPAAILYIIAHFTQSRELAWTAYFLNLLLYLHVIRLFMRKIFESKVVSLNTIGMALCTYVLIGSLWMMFYIPVYVIDPQAFSFNVTPPDHQGVFAVFSYFSYVTLTTLGYGDISPVSEMARALAVLEALTGTLFLAVLISRLVGSYSNNNPQ